MAELIERIVDLSGGLQNASSRFLQKNNELSVATNVDLSEIGKAKRIKGYISHGGMVESGKNINNIYSYYRKNGEYKLLVSVNNSDDSYSNCRYESGDDWTSIMNDTVNATMYYQTFMDYCFIVGHGPNGFITTSSLLGTDLSTSVNVYGAPKGKYITLFSDRIHIGNCQVDGVNYPSRVYVSSLPTKIITYVNGDQSGTLTNIFVDSTKYLKSGMSIDIYKGGTEQRIYSNITITDVNNSTNQIWFDARAGVTVSNKDEIYLHGKKDEFVILWDTDNDYLEVATDDGEEITALGSNKNRMLVWKWTSTRQWDGANLVTLSDDIGTVSQKSVCNMSDWTLFFDKKGFYALSGSTFQLLSEKLKPYIDAIYQYDKVCAGVTGSTYKAYIGQLGTLGAETTSTSTSSTSTSSTSSSTSTTTSFSSTSTSLTTTTTSTSSTSSSTSSTSSSTSSTSTSSTSAVTTFVGWGLTYNFNQNNWVGRKYNRRITCFATHRVGQEYKLFFGDNTGYVYEDNNGFTDDGYAIPMEIETGRRDQGYPELWKETSRVYVHADPGAEAVLMYSIDGGQFEELGQIRTDEKGICSFDFIKQYHDIAWKITQTGRERPIVFEGLTFLYNIVGRKKE